MLFSGIREKDLIPHPFAGNCNDVKKFVILTYPRTGSHYLIFKMRSSGNIVGYGELFNQKKTFRTLYPDFNPDEKQASFRNKNPKIFLNHIYSNYNETVKAVGFKINYNQLTLFKNAKLIKLLNDTFNVSWIHLKRRNSLQSYVSLKLMQQTNICFAVKPEIEDVFSKNTRRYIGEEQIKDYNPVIKIHTDDMIHHIKSLVKEMNYYDSLLKNTPHHEFFYEDFENDISGTISEISEFLFQKNDIIKPDEHQSDLIVKLNNRPLHKVIENYDEVCRALNSAGFGNMVLDPKE